MNKRFIFEVQTSFQSSNERLKTNYPLINITHWQLHPSPVNQWSQEKCEVMTHLATDFIRTFRDEIIRYFIVVNWNVIFDTPIGEVFKRWYVIYCSYDVFIIVVNWNVIFCKLFFVVFTRTDIKSCKLYTGSKQGVWGDQSAEIIFCGALLSCLCVYNTI